MRDDGLKSAIVIPIQRAGRLDAMLSVGSRKKQVYSDEHEATLLRYLKALVEGQGQPPMHLHEEARESGWTDEQILEAIAATALETFTAMINVAGEVPVDG